MTITASQDEELTDILMALQAELKRPNSCITGRAVDFVNDQVARHRQYGTSISLSPKQWTWLHRLYEDATGEKPEPDDRGNLEPVDDRMARTAGTERRDYGPDDEIPF